MKNEQTAVIKDMEFLLNELHKEWERPGEVKSSVSIPYEKVEEISRIQMYGHSFMLFFVNNCPPDKPFG